MSARSEIEWTDATWNPVRGCTKVSPGCAHCYAERLAERFRGVPGHPFERGFDLQLVPERLSDPLKWHKPRRIFVNSMSDLFHEDVPCDFIDRVFAVMALCPQHTFQVLTKRPKRMAAYLRNQAEWIDSDDRFRDVEIQHRMIELIHRHELFHRDGRVMKAAEEAFSMPWPLPNVWLGVSVEDQKRADERIPLLLQCLAAVRFLSCEPLLEEIELHLSKTGETHVDDYGAENAGRPWIGQPDWVIVGGESGIDARPCAIEWIRDLVSQCQTAGVPCFVKQLGSLPTMTREAWRSEFTEGMARVVDSKKSARIRRETPDRVALALSGKGGRMDQWPVDLRVREWPVTPIGPPPCRYEYIPTGPKAE